MKIQCLIVEDEPLATQILQDFIAQVPFLELAGCAPDAFSAKQILASKPVDLMFLDIHLPKLKGLDFLAGLTQAPLVIVTSAYHEFAVEGYQFNVLDYLLKPIEFSRFVTAVNKAFDRMQPAAVVAPDVQAGISELFFNVNKKKARVDLNAVLYIESQRENVKIVTTSKTILTRYPISELEKELPPQQFIRVHRSFIVNRSKIDFIDAQDVEVGGKELPIGRNYRDYVLKSLGIRV